MVKLRDINLKAIEQCDSKFVATVCGSFRRGKQGDNGCGYVDHLCVLQGHLRVVILMCWLDTATTNQAIKRFDANTCYSSPDVWHSLASRAM